MLWLIVLPLLVVLAVGGHLVAGRWPRVPKLAFATGLLLAVPTLVAQGVVGLDELFGAMGMVSEFQATLLFFLPAAVVGLLFLPLGHVRWQALGRIHVGLLFTALALFAVVTAPLLAVGVSTGAPQRAEHAWETTIEPVGEASYRAWVPFFWAAEPRAVGALEALREEVQVVEGQASFTITREGPPDANASLAGGSDAAATWLVVEAQGPVELAARHAFYGSTQHREAFLAFGLWDGNVTLEPLDGQGNLTADVRMGWDMSGGEGHTCWSDGLLEAALVGQRRAPLSLAGGTGDAGRPEDLRFGLPGVCA